MFASSHSYRNRLDLLNGDQMGTKNVCARVCACAWGGHLFEGANAFKRIQMRNRDNGGAVLYATTALEGFVCLLVCVSVCV